jgi:aminoglycoside phosphotransferase (APT) family kinase protein
MGRRATRRVRGRRRNPGRRPGEAGSGPFRVAAGVFEPCREFVAAIGGHAFEAGPLRDGLLHGDLHAGHLLVDPAGRVVGLIDWADACLGDPAYDLKFLWVLPGEHFVEEVLSFYDGPIDPGFLDRIRFYGVCTAVDEVAYGLSESRDENLRRGLATLRRTFAAGGPAR